MFSAVARFAFPCGIEVFGDEERTPDTITVQTSRSPTGAVKNLGQLLKRLKARGGKIARKGRVEQPFFSVTGQLITVSDQDVQVFEYRTVKAPEVDARKVSGTGTQAGTSIPMWIAPPHFFKSGRLIVLYVGKSSFVVKALADALGPQFDGG